MKTIFFNSNIITLNNEFPEANWIITENNKIVSFGKNNPPTVSEKHEALDLKKQTLTPGLEDCHVHFFGVGYEDQILDLGKASSGAALKSLVEKNLEHSTEPTIIGRGFNNNLWEDKTLNKTILPDTSKPIILIRVDGHAILVNDIVLQKCNITNKTPSPAGGAIEKDQSGNLTGIIVDNAINLVSEKFPNSYATYAAKAYAAAEKKFFENGIVKIHDMGITNELATVLNQLYQENKLKIKSHLFYDGSHEINIEAPGIRGIKLFADGALGSKGAYLNEPYKNSSSKGLLTITATHLKEVTKFCLDKNLQLAIHIIGDGALRFILENLYEFDLKNKRFRLEHLQICDHITEKNFIEQNLIASIQPCHYLNDKKWLNTVLSKKQISRAYNWKKLLALSPNMLIGTDAPVEPINPIRNFIAISERTSSETISKLDLLTGYTKNAAFSTFDEHSRGQIKNGFDADFTLFSKSPLHTEINDLKITGIILNGDIIKA